MALQTENKPWIPTDAFDIQNLFRKYNLWKNFTHNDLSCFICRENISLNNLGTVFENEKHDDLKLICSKPSCLRSYLQKRIETVYS